MDKNNLPYITHNTPKKRVVSPIPKVCALIVATTLPVFMGIQSMGDILFVGGSALFSYLLVSAIFPPRMVADSKTQTQLLAPTGNQEADQLIKDGVSFLEQIQQSKSKIRNQEMILSIQNIIKTFEDILKYLQEHPQASTKLRRVFSYYLPTMLKLLDTYDRLEEKKGSGENIDDTLLSIQQGMSQLSNGFAQQLNGLYEDVSLDITTDIRVMEELMEREGLIEPKTKEE